MNNNKIVRQIMAIAFLAVWPALCSAQTNQSLSKNETIKTNTMKEYVLLIRLPLNYGQAQAAEVRDKWNALTDKWKADGIFVTSFVFPTESYLIAGKERTVKKEAVVTNETKVITTIVLKAASYEEALEQAERAPILDQGGTIELREAFPRPQ